MLTKIAEIRQMNQIPTFIGEVAATEEITSRLRRVTIGGEDLARFEPKGPDQFLYLLLPPPGRNELTVDADFTWTGYRKMPKEERPVGAYYTVRHHRPESREIDFDMVLHESDGTEGGHASEWAAQATPGDPVALWGPRVGYQPPETTTDVYLFVDETGVPAASCITESLPAGQRAHVFCEVDGPEEEAPIGGDDVVVRWLHRNGAPAGSTTLLKDAATALPSPDPATTYVYGGAESRTMKAIRKLVRRTWGVPKESASLVPYWRATAEG